MNIEKYTNIIIKNRVKFILLTIITIAIFGFFLKSLKFEGNYRIWFEPNSKIVEQYDNFKKVFGSDDGLIISFRQDEGIFTKKHLQNIADLTQDLATLEQILRVDSITNYQYIKADDKFNDDIIVQDLVMNIETLNQEQLNNIKKIAINDPDLVNTLISKDGTTTMIFARLSSTIKASAKTSFDIRDHLRAILKPYESMGYRFYVNGGAIVSTAFIDIAKNDGIYFTSLVILSVLIVLMIIFRSILGSFIPLLVVIFSFIIVLAVQVILGYRLNNFTANLPLFIIAIGIAHAVHIYWVWMITLKSGVNSSSEAIIYSLNKNLLPIFLTTLTTVIGFLSLSISDIVPIKTLGIATATGSIIAFLLSIVFLPAVLSFFHPTYNQKQCVSLINSVSYSKFIIKYDRKIIQVSIFILIVFIAGIFKVKVDSNMIKYFNEDLPIRKSLNFISDNLTGPMNYEIIVDSQTESGIYSPDFLLKVDNFSKEFVSKFEDVRSAKSLVNVIKRFNQVMNENRSDKYTIPNSSELIAQYLLMYTISLPPGLEVNDKMDITKRFIRITAQTNIVDSSKDLEMIDWIQRWWSLSNYSVEVNGKVAMLASMQKSITQTLTNSIILAVILVSIVMMFIFKKIRLFFYFLAPNIIPIAAAIGAMGWFGIHIDMGVAISAAIILGVAVDDTIHFLTKYLYRIRAGYSVEESIEYVMRYAGGAIVFTTIILSVSFAFLLGSNFNPNVYFAITTITAVIIALITDLFLLPALLSFSAKREKRKEDIQFL